MDAKRRSLGMGLSALLGADAAPDAPSLPAHRMVRIGQIRPGKYQPRRAFDEDKLIALAQSIAAQGILQPLLVRPDPDRPRSFELVAGERRWRAAQRAQLHEVPVIVRDLGDRDALEIALIENVQRQDLNPLEEAEAYSRLMSEFRHTQEQLAAAVGKSRSHVANTLRLLESTPKVRAYLASGKLTAGHARALLRLAGGDRLADEIVARGLSVRQAERLATRPAVAAVPARDANLTDMEQRLSDLWGLTVQIAAKTTKSGSLVIRYEDLDQLQDFIQRVR